MTANDRRSCLGYLNQLVEKKLYLSSYYDKKPIDGNHSALTEEIESKIKATKFKVGDRVRIT